MSTLLKKTEIISVHAASPAKYPASYRVASC